MKRFFLLIILLGLIGGAGYFGYQYLYPMLFGVNDQTVNTPTEQLTPEPENSKNIDSTTTDTTETDSTIIAEERSPIIEEPASNTAEPITNKRKVPTLSEKKLFENNFVRFAYPSSLEIQTKTMNSLEVFKDTERIGLISIYNNEANTPLEDFLKSENLVDYFNEGAKFSILPTDLEIPTAKRSFLFKDFPGFVKSDIAVLEFDKLIVVVSDWSASEIVKEYIVPSIEKIN